MVENANSPQEFQGAQPKKPRLKPVRSFTSRMRFRVILSMLHFRAREATGEGFFFLLHEGVEVQTLSALVGHLHRQFRVSERNIWRWYARFLESGHRGLIDRPRRDKATFRAFKGRAAAVAFVASKHSIGWSVPRIHRALDEAWQHIHRDRSRCPTRQTVQALISLIAPAFPRKRTSKRLSAQLAVVGEKNA